MKMHKTIVAAITVLILITSIAQAQTVTTVQAATAAISLPLLNIAPIPFDGGVIIGNMRIEKISDQQSVFIVDGDIGFILPKDNPGGIITLSFTQPPEKPMKSEFHQFPLSLEPQSTDLDGKPVEIQIAPKQMYLFIHFIDTVKFTLSSVEFQPVKTVSDAAVCGCTQVKLLPKQTFKLKNILRY